MKAAIAAALAADSTLMALLTGGLHSTVVEISRQNTPTAFDEFKELLPCGLLKLSTDVPIGPYRTSSRLGFTLFWYERFGMTSIEAARKRAYTLLHRRRIAPTDDTVGAWKILHSQDLLDLEDDPLKANLIVSRYSVNVVRS